MSRHDDGEPISYHAGKVIFSDQFTGDSLFRAVIPIFKKDGHKAQDLGKYLFFVFSPKSIYKAVPEAERLMNLKRSGHLKSVEWLSEAIKNEEVLELREHYARLVMLPAERLRLGLVEAIDRLLTELSSKSGEGDDDYFPIIEKGKKLHSYAKEIEAMVISEKSRKARGGYKEQMYERRGSAPKELQP